MVNKEKLHSITLASIAFVLVFLISISSTALAVSILPEASHTSPRTYTVNLTVNNENETTSKTAAINIKTALPTATYAYIPNQNGSIDVIDTANNTITANVPVGSYPSIIAVSPDRTKVYVANYGDNDVYVIDTITNTVTDTVYARNGPIGIAVTPDRKKIYVANFGTHTVPDDTVSVIDTTTNTVIATVEVGHWPRGIAVNPDGKEVYVVGTRIDQNNSTATGILSVIDTATETVTSTIPIGINLGAIAVNPAGTKAYLIFDQDNVSEIDIVNYTVTSEMHIGNYPYGIAISPWDKGICDKLR